MLAVVAMVAIGAAIMVNGLISIVWYLFQNCLNAKQQKSSPLFLIMPLISFLIHSIWKFSSTYDIESLSTFWHSCKIVCFVFSLLVPTVFEILKTERTLNVFSLPCDRIEFLPSSPVLVTYVLLRRKRSSRCEYFLIECLEKTFARFSSQVESFFFTDNWFQRLEIFIFSKIGLILRPKIDFIVAEYNLRFIRIFDNFFVVESIGGWERLEFSFVKIIEAGFVKVAIIVSVLKLMFVPE